MQLRDVMTKDPVSISKDATIQEAAALMADEDIGSLPVIDGNKLVGIVTDRDIVIRSIARGEGANGKVSDAMTRNIVTCAPDTELRSAAATMAERQIRRLYVVEDGDLSGVVSLGDLAIEAPTEQAAQALKEISRD